MTDKNETGRRRRRRRRRWRRWRRGSESSKEVQRQIVRHNIYIWEREREREGRQTTRQTYKERNSCFKIKTENIRSNIVSKTNEVWCAEMRIRYCVPEIKFEMVIHKQEKRFRDILNSRVERSTERERTCRLRQCSGKEDKENKQTLGYSRNYLNAPSLSLSCTGSWHGASW